MKLLILSILALFVGPLFYEFFIKDRSTNKLKYLSIIDGFVFISITGLLLEHIIPHIYEEANFWLFGFLILGFLGPNILESKLLKAAKSVHAISLLVALLGLLLHSIFDGAGLAMGMFTNENPNHQEVHKAFNLPIALIIHNLPVGLTIWWLLAPGYGRRISSLLIVAMSLATATGFLTANYINIYSNHDFFHYFEAFFIGSLLHVVFFRVHIHDLSCCTHGPDEDPVHDQVKKSSTSLSFSNEAIGNLLGIIFLYFLFRQKDFSIVESKIFETILSLAYQTAPALCIAYLFAGLLHAFLPNSSIQWLRKGGRTKQALKGVIFGLPLPICSCGVLPFYRSLIDKKVPMAAAIGFLIATPEIGIDAFLVSLPLLGMDITLLRLAAAAILAFSLAMIFSLGEKKKSGPSLSVLSDKVPFPSKLKESFRYGLVELVDTTGPWIVIGILVAGMLDPILNSMPFSLPYNLDVVVFSLIGVAIYICATGATPFVAILISSGLSHGAAIAFLLTGPATNISTFGVLSGLHGKRFAFLFALATASGAITLGIIINEIFPNVSKVDLSHTLHHHDVAFYQEFSLYLVLIILLYSVFRRGARAFFSEII